MALVNPYPDREELERLAANIVIEGPWQPVRQDAQLELPVRKERELIRVRPFPYKGFWNP